MVPDDDPVGAPDDARVDANVLVTGVAAQAQVGAVVAAGATGGAGSVAPAAGAIAAEGGSGLYQKVYPRTDEYVYATRNDLRELLTIGWLHQSLIAIGTFFFSGAFWLGAEILAHQPKFEFTAWLGMCLVSIIAGGTLAGAGLILFGVKQRKLNAYFPPE